MTRAAGARLLVNSRHPQALWEDADGVHLTSRALAASAARPPHAWVGASVHGGDELARAGALGLDFAVLGPVLPTASHAGQPSLGWNEFERIAGRTTLPVYALGGLGIASLPLATVRGAHGVALLSGAWIDDQCFDAGVSVGGVSSESSAGPPGTT